MLIDTALGEVQARGTYKRPISLLNASTGEEEQWSPLDFAYVVGWQEMKSWYCDDWPEGWVRPWKKSEEE